MKPTAQKVANVGVNALSRETGVSAATISKRLRSGQTAAQIRTEFAARKGLPLKRSTGQGRPPEAPAEYAMVIQRRAQFEEMEKWKLRRHKALAERQELENMLRRGELLPVSYVRTWASRFLVDGRDELVKGPSELADSLAAETDALKVAAILRAWVDRTLAKFEQLDKLWQGDLDNREVA